MLIIFLLYFSFWKCQLKYLFLVLKLIFKSLFRIFFIIFHFLCYFSDIFLPIFVQIHYFGLQRHNFALSCRQLFSFFPAFIQKSIINFLVWLNFLNLFINNLYLFAKFFIQPLCLFLKFIILQRMAQFFYFLIIKLTNTCYQRVFFFIIEFNN